MKKFKISMEGNVNGIETTFTLQIDFTEKQLQQYVVQQALLEAEHKGFEDVKILNVEEASPEYVQMKLFPDDEVEESPSSGNEYQAYGDSSTQTYEDLAEEQQFDGTYPEEELSEEDTQEGTTCCDSSSTAPSEYTPYNSNQNTENATQPSYTAYAPAPSSGTVPKSYHVKLGNDYAPYRSYRINISTTKDIT